MNTGDLPKTITFWIDNDPDLLFFINQRKDELNISRSEYLRKLVKLDQNGLVAWDGNIERDPILEILKTIAENLGLDISPSHSRVTKMMEIGEDLTEEQVISVLTEEGIL